MVKEPKGGIRLSGEDNNENPFVDGKRVFHLMQTQPGLSCLRNCNM
jgi:hypothetical protein